MDEQRAKARAAWAGSGETADQAIWFDVRQKAGATEFLGYDTERAEGQVKAIVLEGKEVPALKAGQTGWIVTNQTPFYAESGGQLGDTGRFAGTNGEAAIVDVQKMVGDLHAHHARVEKGELKIGDEVDMIIDRVRLAKLRADQYATFAARGAAPPSRRACDAEGLAGGARPAALRHQPHQGDLPGGTAQDRGRGQRAHPAEQLGRHPPDDARGGDAAGAMALFGEIRRGSARAVDGRRAARNIRSSCGGTPCAAHRRHRPVQDRGRGRGRSGVRRIEAVAARRPSSMCATKADLWPKRRRR
jgi:alanyl-tRNA synthetase